MEDWNVWDTMGWMKQIGVMPEMDAQIVECWVKWGSTALLRQAGMFPELLGVAVEKMASGN